MTNILEESNLTVCTNHVICSNDERCKSWAAIGSTSQRAQ